MVYCGAPTELWRSSYQIFNVSSPHPCASTIFQLLSGYMAEMLLSAIIMTITNRNGMMHMFWQPFSWLDLVQCLQTALDPVIIRPQVEEEQANEVGQLLLQSIFPRQCYLVECHI